MSENPIQNSRSLITQVRSCVEESFIKNKIKTSNLCKQDICDDFFAHLKKIEKMLINASVPTLHKNKKLLLKDFPVVIDIKKKFMNQWIVNFNTFLKRLCDDKKIIEEKMNFKSSRFKLTTFKGGLSDFHHGNQTVIFFELNNEVKLVFKPVAIATSKAYSFLHRCLHQVDQKISVNHRRIIDRDNYGWDEFIETRLPTSMTKIEKLFYQFGQHQFLLQILHGRDFYKDNVTYDGENVVIYDTEGCLHPEIKHSDISNGPKTKCLRKPDSISKTGLLFQKKLDPKTDKIVDVSAIFGTPSLLEKIKRKKRYVLEKFIRGYQNTYLAYRNLIKTSLKDEIKETFSSLKTRFILSSTVYYKNLLTQSLNYKYLNHQNDRNNFIKNKLEKKCLIYPTLNNLTLHESKAIEGLDIPHFTTITDQTHLFCNGELVTRDFFPRKPIQYLEDSFDRDFLDEIYKKTIPEIVNLFQRSEKNK